MFMHYKHQQMFIHYKHQQIVMNYKHQQIFMNYKHQQMCFSEIASVRHFFGDKEQLWFGCEELLLGSPTEIQSELAETTNSVKKHFFQIKQTEKISLHKLLSSQYS